MKDSTTRTVLAAAAVMVAVVSVAAAAVVLVNVDVSVKPSMDDATTSAFDEMPTFSEETETIEAPAGPALEPGWQIDAETVYGRQFAAFRSPTASLTFDLGVTGVIDAGDVLVTAMGLPNPRSSSLDAVEFVALDAADGSVRWKKSPGAVDECASVPVQGEIVCLDTYSDVQSIVVIGLAGGDARRMPIPEDWFAYALESDGTSVFVLEGNPEDGESVLHGGSIDALDRMWSRPITSFAGWDGVSDQLIHAADGRGVVTLGGEATFFDPTTGAPVDSLDMTSDDTIVDSTGATVWELPDPFDTDKVIGNTRYSIDGPAYVATTDSGEVRWHWTIPDGRGGFTDNGTIVQTRSGVFFLGTDSMVRLESVPS
ncbi:hypothetical protein QM588_21095 [Rhodococcus sp. IEGM 1354]|uniref:hypothetical protein n=1 Tax=Rhodococcus sp. IEGM 1354 TaxID=3047088 RepID=UPI0024B7B6F8|nr:hypothetical protein [Rhodococcus sp. IEGM 1354]MDI9932924.1 hypothetical protein [Rhodococcus sp. IEGM 1354]